jgi:hypothetical protein
MSFFDLNLIGSGSGFGGGGDVAVFDEVWQAERGRKHLPRPNLLRGAEWGDLAVIQGLRKSVFL